MDQNINHFTFYKNYYDIIKYLNGEDKMLIINAILEYMFEDIEPEWLKVLEQNIFDSFRKRMESSIKKLDGNSKWGQNSHWGWRPWNTSSELSWENKSKTSQRTSQKQLKNNEEEVEDNNILSYDNIYSSYYWKKKWIDVKVCDKLINSKLKQGITLDDIKKWMVLYNCECRLKQDFKFVKKFETWIKEFQPLDEQQINEELYAIIKSYRDKKKSDEKFWQSTYAKTLWNDLKQQFGEEKVKWMLKQANSIQLNFT